MNRRALVVSTIAAALVSFAIAGFVYSRSTGRNDGNAGQNVSAAGMPVATPAIAEALVRPHSPVIGPRDARVTIVEFFDPSCEACRAFYPVVKDVMARYPREVRLVIRYAALHPGSEEAIRILEAARLQDVYVPVLEALLESQPQWHDGEMSSAWAAAQAAGLDVQRARGGLQSPEINATLRRDMVDLQTVGVHQTPTFFVNGQPLTDFGVRQFQDLVQAQVEAGAS